MRLLVVKLGDVAFLMFSESKDERGEQPEKIGNC